jgi:glycerophosphoryl diester phosphodiesterase
MIRFLNQIVANRGLRGHLPENSLAAMCAAWDAGISCCKCDVQLSSDGVPIVIHDETLDRTTNGRGGVADFIVSELQQLNLLGSDGKVTGHRVPLLDELLEKCGIGRQLLVEIKPPVGNRIYPIAKKIQKKEGRLQSFHLEDLVLAAKATMNRCPVALLVDKLEGDLPAEFHGMISARHESLSPEVMNRLKEHRVAAWTVNDPERIRQIMKMGGVDMIITDIPLVAKEIVEAPLRELVRRAEAEKLSAIYPKTPPTRKSVD